MLNSSLDLSELSVDQVLRWPTERAKKWTCNFLEHAKDDPSFIALVAIGSAVRPSVSSVDFDLLVICENREVLHLSPPIEVDLRVYLAAEVDGKVEGGHDLLVWAVMFGQVLYQR